MFEIDDPTTIDYTTRPYDAINRQIIGAAIEVHKALGPGLFINFNVWRLKQGIRRIII